MPRTKIAQEESGKKQRDTHLKLTRAHSHNLGGTCRQKTMYVHSSVLICRATPTPLHWHGCGTVRTVCQHEKNTCCLETSPQMGRGSLQPQTPTPSLTNAAQIQPHQRLPLDRVMLDTPPPPLLRSLASAPPHHLYTLRCPDATQSLSFHGAKEVWPFTAAHCPC